MKGNTPKVAWGYDACLAKIASTPGGMPGRGSTTNSDVLYKATFDDLCPYAEGAIERAINFQNKLQQLEGTVAASHPRNQWILQAKRDLPRFMNQLQEKERKIEMKYEIPQGIQELPRQIVTLPPTFSKVETPTPPVYINPLLLSTSTTTPPSGKSVDDLLSEAMLLKSNNAPKIKMMSILGKLSNTNDTRGVQ